MDINCTKYVIVAYIDFSRAFDSVSLEKLLVRLKYDVRGMFCSGYVNFSWPFTSNQSWGSSIHRVGFAEWSSSRKWHWTILFFTYINDLAQLLERHGIQEIFC